MPGKELCCQPQQLHVACGWQLRLHGYLPWAWGRSLFCSVALSSWEAMIVCVCVCACVGCVVYDVCVGVVL